MDFLRDGKKVYVAGMQGGQGGWFSLKGHLRVWVFIQRAEKSLGGLMKRMRSIGAAFTKEFLCTDWR